MRVVFYALSVVDGYSVAQPEQFSHGEAVTGYFVMRKVYHFIEDHWDKLCPHKNSMYLHYSATALQHTTT